MAWAGSTPSLLTSGGTSTAGTTATTASVTFTAGRLYVMALGLRRTDSVNVASPTSVVRGSESFTTVPTDGLVQHDTSGSSRMGLWMGTCISAGTSTGTVVATMAASYANYAWVIAEITSGFDSGSLILQSKSGLDISGAASNFVITYGSSMASDSLSIGAFADTGVGTLTPGTGYTELAEAQSTVSPATALAYNTSPDTTFDYSYTLTEWVAAIAIEIKAAAAATTVKTLAALGVG